MNITLTYDKGFDDLMERLRKNYPAEAFSIDGIGEQHLDINAMSKSFFGRDDSTTADHSADPNANVAGRDVITYAYEVPKPLMKLNSYYNLWKTVKELHNQDLADSIITMQVSGDIYINDVWDIGRPYCFNFSTLDIALEGLKMGGRLTVDPPKSLFAFLRQVEQFTVYCANATLGATGMADLLIVAARYVDDILRTGFDNHIRVAKREEWTLEVDDDDVWDYVFESLTSLIYTLNWEFRGNQCVTEDTEVLTPAGFKTLDTLKEGDDIYTWKDGDMNVNKVQRVNIHPYDGMMHSYKGRDVEQVVTPNHRVLYKTGKNPYRLDYSENIFRNTSPLTFPVTMRNTRVDYCISDTMLELVTFILTDGNIEEQEGHSPRVSWSKSPNRWGAERFAELCEDYGLLYSDGVQKSVWGGEVHTKKFYVEDSARILSYLPTKEQLPEWFFELSQRQARLVLDLWAKTDGYKENGRMKLQVDNDTLADQLQHLCFLAGRGSRIIKRVIGKNNSPTTYVIVYARDCKDATKKEEVYYKGRVWCPTTEDGVVMFRKNGKMFVSGNSPFTNVSIYDRTFLQELLPTYNINGKTPDLHTVERIQETFLTAFNEVLDRTPATFPVVTACFSVKEYEGKRQIQDQLFLKRIAKANLPFGFINLYCGESSTLSSCCRLRSKTSDLGYSNTFGAGSTKIGSLGVVTLNLPRLASEASDIHEFLKDVRILTGIAGVINQAKRAFIRERIERGSLPLYTLGYMDLSRQYSTTGFTGLYEAMSLLGYDMRSPEGMQLAEDTLSVINEVNERMSVVLGTSHNMEQVPAETSSIKLAKKDALFGYDTGGHEFYSNQFIPLWENVDMLDRIKAQGHLDKHCTGGAICHLNVGSRIEKPEVMEALIHHAAESGVVYFAVNYQINKCVNGHMTVGREDVCPLCKSPITDTYTRVVGFLTNTKHWHKVRREHDWPERTFA